MKEEVLQNIKDKKITSREELDEILLHEFHELCETHGRQEYESTILPLTKEILGEDELRRYYTCNCEIILESSTKKTNKIEDYLKNLPANIREYHEHRKEKREQAFSAIYDTITLQGSMGDVTGVLVHGSMAQGNNHLFSDVDLALLTRSQKGNRLFQFEGKLKRRSKNQFRYEVTDHWNLEDFKEGYEGSPTFLSKKCVLVSPDTELRNSMQEFFENQKEKQFEVWNRTER